jgi:uncharacterized protein with FMN-binding domain
MFRIISIAAALAASTVVIGATASHAQGTSYYTATPAAEPTKTSFLTRETMWKWRDGAFVANKSADRDIIVCSLVAQRAGKLTSFAVAGTPVDAATLEKCNAKAK